MFQKADFANPMVVMSVQKTALVKNKSNEMQLTIRHESVYDSSLKRPKSSKGMKVPTGVTK